MFRPATVMTMTRQSSEVGLSIELCPNGQALGWSISEQLWAMTDHNKISTAIKTLPLSLLCITLPTS